MKLVNSVIAASFAAVMAACSPPQENEKVLTGPQATSAAAEGPKSTRELLKLAEGNPEFGEFGGVVLYLADLMGDRELEIPKSARSAEEIKAAITAKYPEELNLAVGFASVEIAFNKGFPEPVESNFYLREGGDFDKSFNGDPAKKLSDMRKMLKEFESDKTIPKNQAERDMRELALNMMREVTSLTPQEITRRLEKLRQEVIKVREDGLITAQEFLDLQRVRGTFGPAHQVQSLENKSSQPVMSIGDATIRLLKRTGLDVNDDNIQAAAMFVVQMAELNRLGLNSIGGADHQGQGAPASEPTFGPR